MKATKLFITALITLTVLFSANAAIDKDGESELATTATTTINGKVIDVKTGEALTGAKVMLEDLGVATYTDFDGNFQIEVKPGTYKIKSKLVSYSDFVKEVNTGSGELTIEMGLENK